MFLKVFDANRIFTRFYAPILLAGLLCTGSIAWGGIKEVQLDIKLFGNLSQGDSGSINCGPTAKTNSMAYLQHKFGTQLIPKQTRDWNNDGQPDDWNGDGKVDFYDDLLSVCDTLSGADYMYPNIDDNGTAFENFVFGQDKYLEGKDVTYRGKYFKAWNTNRMDKPGSIEENKYPDLQYLYDLLNAGDDVEILIDDTTTFTQGHYVTLTSIHPGEPGTIDFIDPRTGAQKVADIVSTADDKLVFRYSYQTENAEHELITITFDATVLGAVAEIPTTVPIPEPTGIALLLSSMLILPRRMRHRR